MTIEALLLMIPACFVINMIPGPNIILSIRNAIQYGYFASMVGIWGRLVAFVFYATLTVIGLGIIITNSVWAFNAVKIIGAIYLVYIGIMSFKNGMKLDNFEATEASKVNYFTLFKQELIVGITNPKVVLIFSALLPQFISTEADFNTQFYLLTAMFCFLEIVSTSLYILVILRFANVFKSTKGQNILSRTIGTFLIGFGVVMLGAKQ